MAVGRVFFSAAPTAQNSPELHFRFTNSFIQSSLIMEDQMRIQKGFHQSVLAEKRTANSLLKRC